MSEDTVGSPTAQEASSAERTAQADARTAIFSSGLPFQLAVGAWIQEARREFSCRVLAEEVPWSIPHADRNGYADLLVEINSRIYCVIECKRERKGPIPFLRSPLNSSRTTFTLLHANREAPFAVHYVESGSGSDEYSADFCAWKDADRRIFENLASEINLATEALAVSTLRDDERKRVFIPVIVTNLPLVICAGSLASVSMETGDMDASDLDCRTVPMVRFQKPIASTLPLRSDPPRRVEANLDRIDRSSSELTVSERISSEERTVWVVSAIGLPDFLRWALELTHSIPGAWEMP